MIRLDVSFRDLSNPSVSSWADPDDMPIKPGSWSDWAVRNVVVSRADNERPNLIAWIIARFFVEAKDAAAFMDISQQSARALLGQPPDDADAASGERPVADEDLLTVREIATTFSRRTFFHQQPAMPWEIPLFDQLQRGLKRGQGAIGARVDGLLSSPFITEAQRLCENVEIYGERGGLYLGAQEIVDYDVRALSSTVAAMWNMGELERLTERHGVDIFFNDAPAQPAPDVGAPSRSSAPGQRDSAAPSVGVATPVTTPATAEAQPLYTRATAYMGECMGEWFQYVIDASG